MRVRWQVVMFDTRAGRDGSRGVGHALVRQGIQPATQQEQGSVGRARRQEWRSGGEKSEGKRASSRKYPDAGSGRGTSASSWRSVGIRRRCVGTKPSRHADRSRDRTAPAPARCKPAATEPECSPGPRPGCRRRCRPPGPAAKHPRPGSRHDRPASATRRRNRPAVLETDARAPGDSRRRTPRLRFPGQRPADGIVRVQVADHPASAVHEQHCRRLADASRRYSRTRRVAPGTGTS